MNKNKKGGAVLGIGRDGCVIDPPILCSTKSDKSKYTNQVSKVIDITTASSVNIEDFVSEFISGSIFRNFDPNGENFLPGLEMCYKKQHELTDEQKKDIVKCNYNDDPYKSLYINILLKKGFSFQKTTAKLNQDDFLKSLAYILLGVKACVEDLGILLLDIKADNLLYSEDKDGKFPVFIDFSNDFVITNQSRMMVFLSNFNQYYDTWTLEMLMIFIKIMEGRNDFSGIRRLKRDILDYRSIDLNSADNKSYMKYINKLLLEDIFLSKSTSVTHYNKIKTFNEKQMCYAIGKIYTDEYNKKVRKTPSFKNKKIEYILKNLETEDYGKRFMANDALFHIQTEVKLYKRTDYLIKNKSITRPIISASTMADLNNIMNNMNLNTPSLPTQLIKSPMTPKSSKKNKKVKTISISYNLKNITPMKLKKMKKPELVRIIKKYKKDNCTKITGLSKNEIIKRILLFQPKLTKKDLNMHTQLTLKKILSTHIITKCNVKQGDKKQILHDFILRNIV